ncbi:MAG TPA: septal ring lytic transglycosylase RlpA family protein [Solirubrobacterales bacterium]|nr:septal ring lytic transglycosylase RlpA family protein [Solirubrobacterales bacterium]
MATAPKHAHPRIASHVSLHVSRHEVLGGAKVVLKGQVRPRGEHRVKLVFRGPEGGVAGATTRPNGSFALRWSPDRIGAYSVRAYGVHERRMRGSASVARHLTSYREAAASYYGPGLYGGGLACGGTLEPGTLGVASKTLPCGAKVKFLYRGETITVPVVDRGPYVAGRDFDLTAATRERLGFPGVGVLLSSR